MPMRGAADAHRRRRRAGPGRRGAPRPQGDVHVDHDADRDPAARPALRRRVAGPDPGLGGSGAPVVLYDEVGRMLTRAVCAWAGVPLADSRGGPPYRRPARHDRGPGGGRPPALAGPARPPPRGTLDRRRHRARPRIGTLPGAGRAARCEVIAEHRDARGRLLPRRIAAVELLNVLRPTVAVDRYVVFAALALHDHPRVAASGSADDEAATEQLRPGGTPVLPVLPGRPRPGSGAPSTGRVTTSRAAGGCCSTCTAPTTIRRSGREPERFRPERFAGWRGDPFALVPQGGGNHCDRAPLRRRVDHHRADEAGGDQPDRPRCATTYRRRTWR